MSFIENIDQTFPVGNAAGWCKSVEEVGRLAQSAAQFIVVGSITVEERAGNPGNTFIDPLNSLGLPNPGIEKISEVAPEMIRIAHEENKPIIMSVAGFSLEEFLTLSLRALELDMDGVELNFGCPNVADGGKRKPIFSFDLPQLEQIVALVGAIKERRKPRFFVSVKVSPMSNPLQIIETAERLSRSNIDALVTQNTFPNGLLYNDDGTTQIQTPDKTGWAGFAGSAIKAMALGQVNQWRRALDSFGAEHIAVWGVGGVQCGRDVRDMKIAGAQVVQVGTAYFVGGPKVFGEMADQYINL